MKFTFKAARFVVWKSLFHCQSRLGIFFFSFCSLQQGGVEFVEFIQIFY